MPTMNAIMPNCQSECMKRAKIATAKYPRMQTEMSFIESYFSESFPNSVAKANATTWVRSRD